MFINKPLQKHYYILQINDKGEGFILRVSYLSHPAVRVKTMKEWTFDQNNFIPIKFVLMNTNDNVFVNQI